jgi:hypothetical protein
LEGPPYQFASFVDAHRVTGAGAHPQMTLRHQVSDQKPGGIERQGDMSGDFADRATFLRTMLTVTFVVSRKRSA